MVKNTQACETRLNSESYKCVHYTCSCFNLSADRLGTRPEKILNYLHGFNVCTTMFNWFTKVTDIRKVKDVKKVFLRCVWLHVD